MKSSELRVYREKVTSMVLEDGMSFSEVGSNLGKSGQSISDVFHNYCRNKNRKVYEGLPRLVGSYYRGEPVLCDKPALGVMRDHANYWLAVKQGQPRCEAISEAILLLVEHGYQVSKYPSEEI